MNLLITGAWKCGDNQIRKLESMGHKLLFLPNEESTLSCDYSWVEGVVCNNLFSFHSIKNFNNLRYIQLTSSGYDRIPLDYIHDHGIIIKNAGNVYSIPIAEYAICNVLEIYKKCRFFYENQKNHEWKKDRGLIELFGKTVAIIGYGSIGQECEKRFKAFGCSTIIIHHDLENLDAIRTADIVVISVPLTKETRGIIKPSQMKKDSILVNVSRGEVVDFEDLSNCTHLLGVVFDVFPEEPLQKDSPLWDKNNYIITPHNAFAGDGNQQRLDELIISNLEDL